MRQDAGKQKKAAQSCYKGDHDRQARSSQKKMEVRQCVYLEGSLMTTSAAERMVTMPCNKLWSAIMEPFKVIKISLTAVTIDEEGI